MDATDSPAPGVAAQLWALAAGYAIAADERDQARFVAVFTPDAVLEVENGPQRARYEGADELAQIPTRLERFARTFHMLGQCTHHIDGDTADGTVYCTAHHVSNDHPPTDHVMFIRYLDRYRRTPEGWRIAHRRVVVDWTATHPVDPPAG